MIKLKDIIKRFLFVPFWVTSVLLFCIGNNDRNDSSNINNGSDENVMNAINERSMETVLRTTRNNIKWEKCHETDKNTVYNTQWKSIKWNLTNWLCSTEWYGMATITRKFSLGISIFNATKIHIYLDIFDAIHILFKLYRGCYALSFHWKYKH